MRATTNLKRDCEKARHCEMEQRVNIKFCFKLGRTATHEMLLKETLKDGKEGAKDEPRSGRPPTSTTPDNIERVRRMLADDRRLSLRMIAEELKIYLDSVSNIIHGHLQKRKKKVYAFPTLRSSSNV
ncbi:hypothetical protein AVEN_18725-1 [Araneus ventricosus]|uniref:Mos1 transposase HTH domain-containing protein n=1 Tax=Araneus ventricosus TaxID=182803 RepID=A0A4Y2GME9_ARAVE|nr:hypothetical protein AVEN_18725-1 [Araneus ventricosus]